jgi:hypothetical protein
MSINYAGLRNVKESKRTSERLLALRKGSLKAVRDQRDDNSFLLATWNIRDFDSNKFGFGPRLDESFFYIAELISCFDLVAVQEITKDLRPFMKLMRILGSSEWDYLLTDVTAGTSGNQERMGFVWRKDKVQFRHVAGEVILPDGQLIVAPAKVDPKNPEDGSDSAETESKLQFARSPYLVSFQSGWFKFSLCTVHIYFGSEDGVELQRRINEIAALVDFFAKRQNAEVADDKKEAKEAGSKTPAGRTPTPQVENYILLGDFNVVSPEHQTMEALESKGFKVPDQIDAKHIPTDKRRHFYDQIAVRVKDPRFKVTTGGVLDVFADVFRDEDESVYRSHVPKRDPEKNPAFKAKDPQKLYEKWRTWQMSDHSPLWVKIESDFADDYLSKIAGA